MKKIKLLLFCCLLASVSSSQNIQLVSSGLDKWFGEFVGYNGALYYTTSKDYSHSLWRTDGTAAGTSLVYQWTVVDAYDNMIAWFTVYKSRLYFTSGSTGHGVQVWSTDGTTAGTQIFKEMHKSNQFYMNGGPMAVLNNMLYFAAFDSAGVQRLWQSDGTENGTTVAYTPDTAVGALGGPMLLNNRLYFSAGKSSLNFGIYSSDGTQAGTSEVKHNTLVIDPIVWNNKIVFNAQSYRDGPVSVTDGSSNGTYSLDSTLSKTKDYLPFNNRFYFFSDKGITRFCVTDGTVGGTVVIKDSLSRNAGNYFGLRRTFPVALNNYLYFCNDQDIWRSDGTASGTTKWLSFPSDTFGGFPAMPFGLTTANGKLYFRVIDTPRVDLYTSDGTLSGTHKISAAVITSSGTADREAVYNGSRYVYGTPTIVYNNQLFFIAEYDTAIGIAVYKLNLAAGVSGPPSLGTQHITVWPNPSHGSFTIAYPGSKGFTSLSVLNSEGQLVERIPISGNGKDLIILKELTPGTYHINLDSSHGEWMISNSIVVE